MAGEQERAITGSHPLPGKERARPDAALRERYLTWGDAVMGIFRWDLQLHFFWGFSLTLFGEAWWPLYGAGIVVTAAKEALDLWSKRRWSWGDFASGLAGSAAALWYCGVVTATPGE